MKIAHVTLYPPKGEKHVSGSGVTSYTKNLVTHIASGSEYEQHILCNRLDGRTETYEENGLIIHRCFDKGAAAMWQIHKELRRIQPDVVHIQQELALFGGIASAYLLQYLVLAWRNKTVITLHGVVDPRAIDKNFVHQNNAKLPVPLVKLAFKIIYTPLAKWARTVIVHEAAFKDVLIKAYRISPNKIAVIPHGVEDLQPTDMAIARQKLRIDERARVALFMGYATGYKGIDLLIEGFAAYAKEDPQAYLIIGAGKHPKLHNDPTYLAEYNRLQQKAAEYIPIQQYRWVGFIGEESIADYYGASSVSLYPYTVAMSSSGPMSFAMGFEKPFLASDAFTTIFESTPHLLFERTPQGFAKRLSYFFGHQKEYEGLSQRLKTERGWTRIAALTRTAYQNLKPEQEEYGTEASAHQEDITAG